MFAAGVLAALGVAVTQVVQLTLIESKVVNTGIEGLFVGMVVYLDLKTLELSVNPQ
ncbi:hypothetical protein BN903_48 [Halorubrum sp. AJ67]|nr:hypothetical protein BN903_48 [Halorubrum sp. AJ67]